MLEQRLTFFNLGLVSSMAIRMFLCLAGEAESGSVLFCSCVGYAFARLQFPAKNTFCWLIMAMMIPIQVTIIPICILGFKMGLDACDNRGSPSLLPQSAPPVAPPGR